MKRFAIWLLLPVALTAACGTQQEPSVNAQTRQQLVSDVRAVKTAASRHDRAATDAALQSLTRRVAAAQAQGRLQPAYARTVLAAAEIGRAHV